MDNCDHYFHKSMDPAHTTPRAVGIPDIVKDRDPYCVI